MHLLLIVETNVWLSLYIEFFRFKKFSLEMDYK